MSESQESAANTAHESQSQLKSELTASGLDQDAQHPRKKGEASSPEWVTSTYLGEGFPYAVVNNLPEQLFTQLGASLQMIGLTSLFHLPWNLKFLWGPLLDQFGTKRKWIILCEWLIVVLLCFAASCLQSSSPWIALSLCFVCLATVSATHDIAIDGYYLEALNQKGQSRYVGYRAFAYRIAALLGGGGLGWVIAKVNFFDGGESVLGGWTIGFLLAACFMVVLVIIHGRRLPRVEDQERPMGQLLELLRRPKLGVALLSVLALVFLQFEFAIFEPIQSWVAEQPVLGRLSVGDWIGLILLTALGILLLLLPRLMALMKRHDSEYARAFLSFLAQPRAAYILLFVVFFRTGESFLLKMKYPFLTKVMGLSAADYNFYNMLIGGVASFTATFIGGWLISKQGLKRWIWPFVLAQNILNLLYVFLAYAASHGSVHLGWTLLVILAEHFGAGLGTAVFMVYIMRCCAPHHKAAHMALLTALMSVTFTLAGMFSGYLAEGMGWSSYFAFTFVATLPAMFVIPLLPHMKEA